jgi:hypothetical protein
MRGNIHGHVQNLVASAARTTTGNTAALALDFPCEIMTVILNLASVTGSSPTLDLYIQTSIDGGATWIDFYHNRQTGSAGVYVGRWAAGPENNVSGVDVTSGDAVLAAGVILNGPIVPGKIRVKWVIAGTTPSFTFAVDVIMSRLSG